MTRIATTRHSRAAALVLAGLASLSLTVGCGGGEPESSAPSAEDIDIPAQLEAGGLTKVNEREGDDKISYIGEGAEEEEITSVETYSAESEFSDYEVFVERFETPEDAAKVAEEYDDETSGTEILADTIVVYAADTEPYARGTQAFDQTVEAMTATE